MGTRDDLLAAAEDLFAEHGYAGVGIRAGAARAAANLSAIKYHSGSKPALDPATTERSLRQPDVEAVWELLAAPPASRAEAGRRLVAFVRAWLARLCDPGRPNACARLMLREALAPSEAIDVVVRDFLQPKEERLVGVLAVLAPDRKREELLACARSVTGQLVHYLVFRPFLERRSPSGFAPSGLEAIADHVASFSLRGLGCPEAFVRKALARDDPSTRRTRSSSST